MKRLFTSLLLLSIGSFLLYIFFKIWNNEELRKLISQRIQQLFMRSTPDDDT